MPQVCTKCEECQKTVFMPHVCFDLFKERLQVAQNPTATPEEIIADTYKKEDKAKRFNDNKLPWADVPLAGLIEVSKVTQHGAKKYDRFNWQKGFPLTQLVDCLMRHLIGDSKHKGALTGQRYDEESGADHFGHACWNILAILHQLSYPEKYKQFFDLEGYKDE